MKGNEMQESRPTRTDPVDPAEDSADAATLPSVVIERRVEWQDTDAAGHYHYSSVQRWVEAAEAVLLRRLGVAELFGRIPRVHFEADYRERLWFGESVHAALRVVRVGASSLHYAFEVRGTQGVAATGRLSVVHCPPDAKGASPWPDEIRAALSRGGPQRPESYA
ncbi:acyl-CoA thioesterase [Embleya scabrispora]|uniref:acyl-CoA thioesterase n=1 Tax=Embleya scabrispora TaxID=159449 RepID=UPI00035ED1A9|nr:thioesterase family protein [Embleya scabrispora]